MSFVPCACYELHCDDCGRAFDGEGVLHVSVPDPADADLVGLVEDGGWTSDGQRWHCERCPELRSPVCWSCRRGDHTHCEGRGCTCTAVATPGQAALALGEGLPGQTCSVPASTRPGLDPIPTTTPTTR